MNYNEYVENANNLIDNSNHLLKQTHVLSIPVHNLYVKENPVDDERIVGYTLNALWEDFSYKEEELLFYINNYLKLMLKDIDFYKDALLSEQVSCDATASMKKATYYFDAMISTVSTIISDDQKEIFYHHLDKRELNDFFPTSDKFDLYWEIYLLQNKIKHFTNSARYMDFSSQLHMIKSDLFGNIHAYCTLIDANKCSEARTAIDIAIKNKKSNPFDILFPENGVHNKKQPILLSISNDKLFDHIESSIALINEIQILLEKLNYLFVIKFLGNPVIKQEILDTETTLEIDSKEIEYSLKDVFRV